MSKYELVTFGNGGYRANGTSELCDPIEGGDFETIEAAKFAAEELANSWVRGDYTDRVVSIGIVQGRDDEGKFPEVVATYSVQHGKQGDWN